MNIDDMSEQEKSCHLVTLCEFEPAIIKGHGACWIDSNYTPVFDVPSGFPLAIEAPNLYDPANMALAWRVLNWASEGLDFLDWWALYDAPTETAEVALCASLDKILELAIEAGMIE